MKSKSEYLFGLIFTIILFLIMDLFAPDISLFIRVAAILLLLLVGRFIYSKLFLDDQEVQ